MFKKLLIASALLAVTGSAFAASPYVGGSVGVNTNTATTVNFRGVPFTAFGGYGGLVTQSIYLAGELAGTVGTATLENNGLQSTYGYAASIVPGVMLADRTLAFARAGVVRTHFRPSSLGSKTVTGGELGLGLQTGLTQNLDLRGEYDYVAYRSFSGLSTVRADQFNLGLLYKFD